jgi:hypothetical protein
MGMIFQLFIFLGPLRYIFEEQLTMTKHERCILGELGLV